MGRRNRKTKGTGWYDGAYWQSADFNQRSYQMHLEWIVSLALARFKWLDLPDTCNARYLESTLLRTGMASIARDDSGTWYTFQAVHGGTLTPYGEPATWEALSANGERRYMADWTSGAIVYENKSFTSPWNTIQMMARKLAHIARTEDINLTHQQTPWLFTAPDNKRLELQNLVKQVSGGEPIILGNAGFGDTFKYEAISTQVPFIGLELNVQYENMWRQVYKFLGIESLAVEKKERVIQEEVKSASEPALLKRLDSLDARNMALDHIRQLPGGFDAKCVFNDDIESFNWAFANSLQMQAEYSQDVVQGGDADDTGNE